MKKMVKTTMILISIVLCVSLALIYPIQVFAQTMPKEANVTVEDYSRNENESDEYSVGAIISEDVAKRDKYSKQFRLDDGSYMAVSYDMPIHYQDSNKKWIDFDNTLIDVKEAPATADEMDFDGYANKNSNINIKYSKKSNESNMIII